MQDLEDVVFVLDQMIENISKIDFSCIEKPKRNKTETEKNFLLSMNKHPDQLSVNYNYTKTSQDPVALKNCYGNCEENTITNPAELETVYTKSSPPVNIQHEKDHIFETYPHHLDEVVNKCSISYSKREDRLKKDVLVQTISHSLATRDSYCQCDLVLENVNLAECPSKKIKLNTDEYSYLTYRKAHWQLETSESLQTEYEPIGNKTNYSDNYKLTSYLKKTSRIRVGLSKHFKLHKK